MNTLLNPEIPARRQLHDWGLLNNFINTEAEQRFISLMMKVYSQQDIIHINPDHSEEIVFSEADIAFITEISTKYPEFASVILTFFSISE